VGGALCGDLTQPPHLNNSLVLLHRRNLAGDARKVRTMTARPYLGGLRRRPSAEPNSISLPASLLGGRAGRGKGAPSP